MTEYTIVQRTQRWRLFDGTWYRDCWAHTARGIELLYVRDDLAGGDQ